MGGYCQVPGFFVYKHLGLAVRTFTLLCNNISPKEDAMKKILSIFAIYGILSNVNAQGWSESFNNVSGSFTNWGTLTSDMIWLKWN